MTGRDACFAPLAAVPAPAEFVTTDLAFRALGVEATSLADRADLLLVADLADLGGLVTLADFVAGSAWPAPARFGPACTPFPSCAAEIPSATARPAVSSG